MSDAGIPAGDLFTFFCRPENIEELKIFFPGIIYFFLQQIKLYS